MSKRWLRLCLIFGLLAGIASLPAQAAFMPLFQVVDVSGDCTADPPGDEPPKSLIGGEGLAYGTDLRTGPDGTLTVLLAADSKIVVGAGALIEVAEDSSNPSKKIIHVHDGKMDLSLAKDFEKENGLQLVTRCLILNYLTGGDSSAEAATEADLRVVALKSKGAQFSLEGPQFLIPLMKENDGITVACADDLSFIRLRCTDGKISVQIKDNNGQTRMVEMVKDSVIKILQKTSETDPNVALITVLIIGPDGEVIEAVTYPDTPTKPYLPPGEEQPGEGPGSTSTTWPPVTHLTTTSSSTTTTTIPPGDVVTTTTKAAPAPAPTTTTKKPPTPVGHT